MKSIKRPIAILLCLVLSLSVLAFSVGALNHNTESCFDECCHICAAISSVGNYLAELTAVLAAVFLLLAVLGTGCRASVRKSLRQGFLNPVRLKNKITV